MRRFLSVVAIAFVFLAVPFAASAASKSVSIQGAPSCGSSSFCFTPGTVNAKVGDKVTWTNTSTAPHTVTRCTTSACSGTSGGSGGQSGPNSPQISQNGTFSMTFTKPGNYVYYCMIHGYSTMHGTIHVTAAATPAPTTPSPTVKPTAAPTATTPTPSSAVAAAAATPASTLPKSGRNVRPYLLWAAVLIEWGSLMVIVSSLVRVVRR